MPPRDDLQPDDSLRPLDHVDLINAAMRDLGWSQTYLANLIRIDQAHLNRLLNRHGRGGAHDSTLERIGEAFQAAGLPLGFAELKRARDERGRPARLPFQIEPRWFRLAQEITALFDETEQDLIYDAIQGVIGVFARMKLRNRQAEIVNFRREIAEDFGEGSIEAQAVEVDD